MNLNRYDINDIEIINQRNRRDNIFHKDLWALALSNYQGQYGDLLKFRQPFEAFVIGDEQKEEEQDVNIDSNGNIMENIGQQPDVQQQSHIDSHKHINNNSKPLPNSQNTTSKRMMKNVNQMVKDAKNATINKMTDLTNAGLNKVSEMWNSKSNQSEKLREEQEQEKREHNNNTALSKARSMKQQREREREREREKEIIEFDNDDEKDDTIDNIDTPMEDDIENAVQNDDDESEQDNDDETDDDESDDSNEQSSVEEDPRNDEIRDILKKFADDYESQLADLKTYKAKQYLLLKHLINEGIDAELKGKVWYDPNTQQLQYSPTRQVIDAETIQSSDMDDVDRIRQIFFDRKMLEATGKNYNKLKTERGWRDFFKKQGFENVKIKLIDKQNSTFEFGTLKGSIVETQLSVEEKFQILKGRYSKEFHKKNATYDRLKKGFDEYIKKNGLENQPQINKWFEEQTAQKKKVNLGTQL